MSEMTIEELIDEFQFLGDWEERCDYLIDMGFDLPEMPSSEKTEQTKVHGCQSNVWLITRVRTEDGRTTLDIIADSDAMIVKGLIAVLLTLYSGKSPAEILDIEPREVFRELGLDRHLSPARKNGLNGMVQRIRELAAQVAA
ncbi:SufE family protein [Thalassoroseus pseudoceratinae]|uniref:SufE family protein n=1 Tax=Thalassoroseus pseudoceratinae TaxID=2713176 RepID=UPI0014226F37|nr:SufE family protein [Thalassoroseus pseudoceratinae]